MKTKLKTFDAVASSRRWREDAGRMLDAMDMSERITFLEGLRVRGAGKVPLSVTRPMQLVVREDEAAYGTLPGKDHES